MRLQDTLAAAFVTLLVDGLAGMVASPKEPAHCQGRLDGVYADHSSDCQDYYVCKSDQQSKKSCPENQRFSALRNACMPSKEVVCIPPSTDMVSDEYEGSESEGWLDFRCGPRPDGVYVDLARDCRQFYICKSGSMSTHYCPEGERFSHVTGLCMAAEDVLCGLPAVSDVCPGDQQGLYADKERGCMGFYRCKDGVRQDFSCPEDLVFDEAMGACVDAASTKCDVTASTGNSQMEIPEKTTRQIKFFRFNGDSGLRGARDERQVKFFRFNGEPGLSGSKEERQVKFFRLNGGNPGRSGAKEERQVKFFRLNSDAGLSGSKDERQVKFGSKRQQRQIKFKRVNQLLRELRGVVKN